MEIGISAEHFNTQIELAVPWLSMSRFHELKMLINPSEDFYRDI